MSKGTFTFDAPGEPAAADPDRYVELEKLGEGAMGEVWEVLDTWLDRPVAMKRLRLALAAHSGLQARFVAEARTTAQLDHPGIVAVLDYGELEDGRMFYTMPIVTGETLTRAIDALDRDDAAEVDRLLRVLLTAARAAGHAHERGVVHRDIKPDNVLIRRDGAARLVDWGISRVLESLEHDAVRGTPGIPTRRDEIAGTPAYMAPEQAAGRGDQIGPASDVYALGRILSDILGSHPADSLSDLVILRDAACARSIETRPQDGAAFADALEDWLSGRVQRERARTLVAEALAHAASSREVHQAGREQRQQARAQLDALPWDATIDERRAAWELEDRGRAEMRRAEGFIAQAVERLSAAIELAPDLEEAHWLLAEVAASEHARKAIVERSDAPELLRRVNAHAERLSAGHPERQRLLDYGHGRGALSVQTEPAQVHVQARSIVAGMRGLLVEADPVPLGQTPLDSLPWPAGAYTVELSHPGCQAVRFPIQVPRAGVYSDARIDGAALAPLRLPRLGELDPDDVFVPRGSFLAGHLELLGGGYHLWQIWCADFVIKRDPVTVEQYLAFLNDLDPAEAAEMAPPAGMRESNGIYALAPDEDGDLWDPRWPMIWVRFDQAKAYAAWYAARTGQPWRLPGTLEWEKAARGVDGRPWPWGLRGEPAFSRLSGSPVRGPARVDELAYDVSPYGVRGLGGNVADWCEGLGDVHCGTLSMLERWKTVGGKQHLRGSGWSTAVRDISRVQLHDSTNQCIGFRLARAYPS